MKNQKQMTEIKTRFLPYEEAREFMHNLQPRIKTQREYHTWRKSGKRPRNIPVNPQQAYENKGWVNWADFLGTENEKVEPIPSRSRFCQLNLALLPNSKYQIWFFACKSKL
jgi:hypothetical protein